HRAGRAHLIEGHLQEYRVVALTAGSADGDQVVAGAQELTILPGQLTDELLARHGPALEPERRAVEPDVNHACELRRSALAFDHDLPRRRIERQLERDLGASQDCSVEPEA